MFYDSIYSKLISIFGCCYSRQERVPLLPLFDYEVETIGVYDLNSQLRALNLTCIVEGIYESVLVLILFLLSDYG